MTQIDKLKEFTNLASNEQMVAVAVIAIIKDRINKIIAKQYSKQRVFSQLYDMEGEN